MKASLQLLCSVGLAVMAPGIANAQTSPASSPTGDQAKTGAEAAASEGLADIVVTAQKREANLQKTPASVQVIGAASLVDHGVTDIVRLQTQVTGLIIQPSRASVYMFSRGLGQADAQYQTSPAIEMQQDGLTLPRSAQQLALFDIGNVQVLKGPQGILYGRYGIGGAVLVNSKRPTYDKITGEGTFEIGNYAMRHGFAAVNLPVAESAGFRASIDYNKHDGYTTNGQDDLDQIAGRLSFQANPTDRFSIFLSGTGAKRTGHGFAQVNFPRPVEANGDPYVVLPTPSSGIVGFANFDDYHNRGYNRQISYMFNGELKYKLLDELTASFVSGYFNNDGVQVNAFANKFGTNFVNYASTYYTEKSWDVQNEARLSYAHEGINAIVGVLQHRFVATDQIVQVAYKAGPYINGPHSPTENNYAVYGDVVVPVIDSLRLEAGARQSWDIKHDKGLLSNQPIVIDSSNFKGFKNLSWKVGAEYDVTSRILTYANIQTGYLPGAYQTASDAVLNSLGLSRRYKSQKVTAYQAGIKSRFWDNRLQFNAEGFYYDYRNFQVTQRVTDPTNPNAFQSPYANIKKSRIYGVDADIQARVIDGGTLSVGLSLLNAKISDSGFTKLSVLQANGLARNELGRNGFPALDPSLRGYDLPFSPRVTLNLGYEQIFDLHGGSQIVANAGTHHESGKWLDYTQSPLFPGRQPGFWKTDLSLTFKAPGNRWSVSVWGHNLENTATYSAFTPSQYRTNGVVTAAFTSVYIDAPRTYGVRVGVNF